MDKCANCSSELPYAGAVCPNCGYVNKMPSSLTSGRAWGLAALGFVLTIVSTVTGIGPLVLIVVYFVAKAVFGVDLLDMLNGGGGNIDYPRTQSEQPGQ